MNVIIVVWAVVTLLSLFVMVACAGCMAGMRIACKLWASPEDYEELYGPDGTCRPDLLTKLIYKVWG
jgi:hypothetical protein